MYQPNSRCTISSCDAAMSMVLELVSHNLTASEIAQESTEDELRGLFTEQDPDNSSAATIYNIATALHGVGGIVPSDMDGLTNLGLDETVSSLLMQNVFGSPELTVGLHARKILTALDILDWEEADVEDKTKVKMVKFPAEKVKRSLKTWLPNANQVGFHDMMESIGTFLASKSLGDWGKITGIVSNKFSTKDKDTVLEMLENICQFYKATKSGGRGGL